MEPFVTKWTPRLSGIVELAKLIAHSFRRQCDHCNCHQG